MSACKALLTSAAAVVVLALAPSRASADWLFTPNIGGGFGANADNTHLSWGASFGYMGARVLGWEVDFAHTPEFFERDDDTVDFIDSSNVTTLMGNMIVGVPIGGDEGSVRPYGTAGLGWLRANVRGVGNLFTADNEGFGFNLGGGVMGFFSDNVGLRGDLRYFRKFEDPNEDLEFDVGLSDFDFWRGTVGVTFRW